MKKIFVTLLCLLLATTLCPMGSLAAEEGTLPLSTTGDTLSMTIQETYYSGNSYADNLPIYQELEKRTGISIVWDVINGNYSEVMAIRMASGEPLSDIIQLPNYQDANVMKYAQSGRIIALDEWMDQYAPNIKHLIYEEQPELGRSMTMYDGHVYYIPQNFYGYNINCPYSLVIRQDWLDKLGLAIPQTPDEWYAVLKAFKEQDPNGNGEADEIPMSSMQATFGWATTYGYFGGAFGLTTPVLGVRYYPDETGRIIDQYEQSGFQDLLTFLNKLYAEGLVDPSLMHDESKMNSMVLSNNVGVCAYFADDSSSWQKSMRAAGLDSVAFTIIEGPRASLDDKTPIRHVARELTGFDYAITADCDNPALAIQWIDYCYANPEGLELMMFGLEGTHWTRDENGKRVWTDYVIHNEEGLGMFNALRKDGANPTQFTNRSLEFGAMCVEDDLSKQIAVFKDDIVPCFPNISATVEETEVLNTILTDLNTYTDEMIMNFITGVTPLEKFNDFVQTMNAMGSEKVLEIKQQQYDRYTGK